MKIYATGLGNTSQIPQIAGILRSNGFHGDQSEGPFSRGKIGTPKLPLGESTHQDMLGFCLDDIIIPSLPNTL